MGRPHFTIQGWWEVLGVVLCSERLQGEMSSVARAVGTASVRRVKRSLLPSRAALTLVSLLPAVARVNWSAVCILAASSTRSNWFFFPDLSGSTSWKPFGHGFLSTSFTVSWKFACRGSITVKFSVFWNPLSSSLVVLFVDVDMLADFSSLVVAEVSMVGPIL